VPLAKRSSAHRGGRLAAGFMAACAVFAGLLLSGCGATTSSAAGTGSAPVTGPSSTSSALGSAASKPAQPSAATQTNDGGQVTVEVTWKGTSAGPVFDVTMNTHAVDLDSYDLRQLASLRVDGGPDIKPVDWTAPKGGHHREGNLAFPAQAADGSLLIGPTTQTIALVVRNVAGVAERSFAWNA